ncbi:hypothetical protein EYF80_040652 [Liparis tanakae]|uniref:Uncharacterized protein n=1 Tax=Liparis tanakae TaxID=230148 RepID=A0A4Z2G8L4_9TELE|nr:hypothetical protein EYF80_040652 [Liparis tanakae]
MSSTANAELKSVSLRIRRAALRQEAVVRSPEVLSASNQAMRHSTDSWVVGLMRVSVGLRSIVYAPVPCNW